MLSPVDHYIRSGSKSVTGWVSLESALLIKVVSAAQVAAGTRGSVGEIGVHHGRLFILLYLLAEPHERAFAIDVFEGQNLIVDGSPEGDRSIFQHHLNRFGADPGRIDIIAESSLEVSSDRLVRAAGRSRLFSVDGGHSTHVALNDLTLAEATLADGGVIILDDVFQSLYPGVVAALAHYLLGAGELVPFAVSPEKVLLTQREHNDRLMDAVRTGLPSIFTRYDDFFGHKVAIIRRFPPLNERVQLGLSNLALYQRIRRAPVLGEMIETARPRVLKLLRR